MTPVDAPALSGQAFTISAGNSHACALIGGNAVKCWGYNGNGQLGDGTSVQRLTAADTIGVGSGVTAITTSTNHTCALTPAGLLKCWGSNAYGQIADNSLTDRLSPVDIRRGQSISFAPPVA